MSLLLRNVIKRSNGITPNGLFSLIPRASHRYCSSGTGEEQSPAPPQPSVEETLHQHSSGFVYGRLTGIGKHTLRTDVNHMLERTDVSPQDVKVEYDAYFNPLSMIVRFPTQSAFDSSLKAVIKKRVYRLDWVERGMWNIQDYDGKVVLIQGLPKNTFQDDVERVLCDFNYDSSRFQVFFRNPMPGKMALVPFFSETDATNAALQKNKSFCGSEQIVMRVLQ